MAGQTKKVQIHLGLLTIPIRLEKATETESSGTKTVCAGTEENPHPPALVKQSMGCTVCDITHSSHYPFPRGVPQGDGFVVLTAEELAEASGEPVKDMTLTLHDRAEVYSQTVASDSVQNVTPDRGGEPGYQLLREHFASHPDQVMVTEWAPSTKNALWVLELVGNRIVATKRCWPEDMRTPPVVPEVVVSEQDRGMFQAYMKVAITKFNPESYRDTARAAREALIAARAGEAVPLAAGTAAPVVQGDMFKALQASIKALEKPAAKKAPAKKAAPRKRAAKKPAEPAA